MRPTDIVSLTKDEATWLLNLLKETKMSSITFAEVLKIFEAIPRLSYKLFAYGLCMVELLNRHDLFPGRGQRLMVAVILFKLFKCGDHLSSSIFSEQLVQIIDVDRKSTNLKGMKKFDLHDVGFLVEVMTGNTRVLNLTPSNAINNFKPADFKPHLPHVLEELTDTTYVHSSFEDRLRLPLMWTVAPNKDEAGIDNDEVLNFTASLLVAVVKNSKNCLKPSMMRPAPPPIEGDLVEIPWHFSAARHLFPPFHKKARPKQVPSHEIVKKSYKNYFIHCHYSFLKKMLNRVDLTQEEVGCLVELILNGEDVNLFTLINTVDREVFVQILTANAHAAKVVVLSCFPSALFHELLSILADITTFRTLEVVKELCYEKSGTTSILPNDFVCKYIENFIQKMTNLEDSSDPGKGRWVRLICAFILSIHKQKLFDLKSIIPTIQSFSCEHTRVKDAQTLYKAIRSCEDC